MAKTRSPSYPAIGLKEAIDKVRAVYESDYQNPIPRAVAAGHMGYKGLNGKSLGVLAALTKFGLLEGRGDNTRVSDRAVAIIAHPPGAPERVAALQAAASGPELFAEIESRYPGGKTSDQAIRSYLLTQKFIPSAADAAIRSYRETKQLVEAESKGYPADLEDSQIMESQGVSGQKPRETHLPADIERVDTEPYRVSFTPGGIEVIGKLTTPEDADELMRVITSLKLLLRPMSSAKRPDTPEAAEAEQKEHDRLQREGDKENSAN